MSETNEVNSDEKLENNSTLSQDDYSMEISDKKNFLASIIDKLKRNNETKLIGPTNTGKPHITNRSISSMSAFGSFRSGLFAVFENVQNFFKSNKEAIPKGTMKPQIVGQTQESTKSKDPEKDKLQPEVTQERYFPGDVLKGRVTASPLNPPEGTIVFAQTETKGIIDNSKSAKDVELENDFTDTIESGTLNVDEEFTDKNNNTKTTPTPEPEIQAQPAQTLQVETINGPDTTQAHKTVIKRGTVEPIAPKDNDDREH